MFVHKAEAFTEDYKIGMSCDPLSIRNQNLPVLFAIAATYASFIMGGMTAYT